MMNGDAPRDDARNRRVPPQGRPGGGPPPPPGRGGAPYPPRSRGGAPRDDDPTVRRGPQHGFPGAPGHQPPHPRPQRGPSHDPAEQPTVRYGGPGDRRRPPVERTQVMHRDGRGEQPLAYSQAPYEAPARPKARPAAPAPRREQRHAPTQRPVPHRDEPPRRTPPPPGDGRVPGAGGRRPRRKKHLGRWFLLLIVVLVGALVAGVIHLDNSLTRIPALANYQGRPGDTPGTNWLLVGSDGRGDLSPEQEQELATGGDTGPERTDTIMLVHIPSSGATTMVSLPRDSYVSIPGHGKDKLNAAFAFGGAPLLVQTVEQATGVHIDHYGQIGFAGFAGVVDSLGGIEVCLDQPISDPLAGLELPQGCQTLDGPQALGFVRTRATALADIDRMNHQRMFMSALLKKATSAGSLVNPFVLWPMAGDVAKSLEVDTGDHIWNIGALGWAMRGETVTTTVPIGGFDDTDVGNVLLWDKAKASSFFEALAEDKPIPQDLLTR